ncbi:hypothetical protein N0V90_007990 [Kalmusia sp. IMI 367209]|nr:hypothetical protein N0V90_007990 [Kalmusia sp. IMI 367209]
MQAKFEKYSIAARYQMQTQTYIHCCVFTDEHANPDRVSGLKRKALEAMQRMSTRRRELDKTTSISRASLLLDADGSEDIVDAATNATRSIRSQGDLGYQSNLFSSHSEATITNERHPLLYYVSPIAEPVPQQQQEVFPDLEKGDYQRADRAVRAKAKAQAHSSKIGHNNQRSDNNAGGKMTEAERQSVAYRIVAEAEPNVSREHDTLSQQIEKNAKIASHSVTSLTKSVGSSGNSRGSTEWLPYTLRWSLVWIPTASSLILGLVVGLLYWRSHKNHGLCPESSAVFGWRFAPTLVAVLWAQLITMLFNDIQRTEPFARLARHPEHVPPASRTILEGPRQVWTAFAHAFNKKHNGGKRSWIIIWGSLILVLASVVVSLSSVLLASEETNIWRPYEMTRLTSREGSTLKPSVQRDTYFRTTGAILQNVTTSPWISDEYVILPFWPSGSTSSPWDAQFPSTPQTWQAETTVFRNDLQCSRLDLAATDVQHLNYEVRNITQWYDLISVRLENDSGCKYNLTFNASDLGPHSAVGSWSDPDKLVKEYSYFKALDKPDWKPIYNDKCLGDEVIIMSTEWLPWDFIFSTNKTTEILANLTMSSYLCQSSHTMAVTPVRVSTSASEFNVDFDIEAFNKAQQKVSSDVLNISQFVELYTDPDWYTYIPTSLESMTGNTVSGALALLATQYDFDYSKMMNDTKLPEQAARVQRRHFGELLRSSLDVQGASQNNGIVGSRMVSERRITVRMEAAAALVALLVFCFFTMLGIVWLSSIRRRPLHLKYEPATVLGTVSLVSSNRSVLSPLRDLDQASTAELRSTMKGRYFSTSGGHLSEVLRNGQLEVAEAAPRMPGLAQKEAPVWVKIRLLLGLVLYIATLVMAIAVVHRFASDSDLKKGFFTYQLNINALGRLGSFTPFSIIPTTLAVLLGLWWNSLDTTFRSLQPYVSMSQAPREIHRGAFVSYQSSYWLWATGKAAKNRHWLLSLVTFGTFLAQAFIIATSALFEQTTGIINDAVQLNRSLELRQLPHLRMMSTAYPPEFTGFNDVYGYDYVGATLNELFGNLTNNWLYSGVIQTTLNGSEPSWSKDGWSFVPIDLSGLDNKQKISNTIQSDLLEAYGSLVNVTLTSPAIRGRVECSPAEIANTSVWISNTTFTNYDTNKTMKGWIPEYEMLGGPLAPDAQYLSCCFNYSDPSRAGNVPNPLAIGFWTQDFANSSEYISSTLNNFTVKWIYGDGADRNRIQGPASIQQSLYFPELPKIQALKCMPIFETSEAEIVVDKQTGRILKYHILKEPSPDNGAWSDAFIFHDVPDPDDPEFKKTVTSTKSLDEVQRYAPQNLTTSYGNLFMNSLLRASRLEALSSSGVAHGPKTFEKTYLNVFNIRNNVTGLTLDFMSYAAYVQENRNSEALLDKDILTKRTQEIFTTFFQHYVSSNNSLTSGGWAYQPIGTNLKDLGAPVNGTYTQYNPDGTRAPKYSELPAQNTQRVADATMSTRVEVLHMNENAVWLCIGLLIWLAITTLIVTALQRWFFGDLRRGVESIADVLVLVAGSERLLAAVERYGVEGLMKSNIKTRLGWFRTDDGRMRWGIEIVEDGEVLMN